MFERTSVPQLSGSVESKAILCWSKYTISCITRVYYLYNNIQYPIYSVLALLISELEFAFNLQYSALKRWKANRSFTTALECDSHVASNRNSIFLFKPFAVYYLLIHMAY